MVRILFIAIFSISISQCFAADQLDIDIKQHEYVQALQEERWADSIKLLNELRSMDVDVGVEAIFFEGRAYYELGDYVKAENRFRQYGELAGREGGNYSQVIKYLSDIGEKVRIQRMTEEARQEKLRIAEEQKREEERIAGLLVQNCEYCPELVFIKGGTFQMGDLESYGKKNELPVHTVTVKSFAIGKYEVTWEEYQQFVQAKGYKAPKVRKWYRDEKGLPMTNLSWDHAKAYTDWLSSETGRTFRLPTEAEWEYAARAGTTTRYYYGDRNTLSCRYANFDATGTYQWIPETTGCEDDGFQITSPVGTYEPNPFNLYDMSGNVAEWLEDCRNDDYNNSPVDGTAWATGDCKYRVIRGGGHTTSYKTLRSSARDFQKQSKRNYNTGFRVVLDIIQP